MPTVFHDQAWPTTTTTTNKQTKKKVMLEGNRQKKKSARIVQRYGVKRKRDDVVGEEEGGVMNAVQKSLNHDFVLKRKEKKKNHEAQMAYLFFPFLR